MVTAAAAADLSDPVEGVGEPRPAEKLAAPAEGKRREPITKSGKALVAFAEALRQDLDELGHNLALVRNTTLRLGEEVPVGGVFGLCRGLASQLEGAISAYKAGAEEAYEGTLAAPGQPMPLEPIHQNVDGTHRDRAVAAKGAR